MYKLIAINIADNIDVRKLKSNIEGKIIIQSSSELFLQTDENKYINIFNNGIVSFVNHGRDEMFVILNKIQPYMTTPQEHMSETLDINLFEGDKVKYENEILNVPNDLDGDDLLRLASYDLSQSIALDYYSNISDNLLSEVEKLAEELEREGKISVSKIDMNKFIGKSLNTRTKIIKNVFVYDNPDIIWEFPGLEQVHRVLTRNFDLSARFREIQTTLEVIDTNLNKFQGMYEHGHSARLEIIVIILIIIEIFNTWGEFLGLVGH